MKHSDNLKRQLPADDASEAAPDTLESLVDAVAMDARRDPEAYARETLVPEGGE